MHGAVALLHHTRSWRGAELKKKEKVTGRNLSFTFTHQTKLYLSTFDLIKYL
jgi:hypothetical protein